MGDRRTIQAVKEAWEDRLMAMPGVTGVGIGLAKDRSGPVIKVYVDRNLAAHAGDIPDQLDEYPVEIEIRGAFKAF